ncbi:putative polypeptide N-acetylgalactosaminyltransferase 9-like protein [Leptotrombidium deliense]|uniref:Polypeptide N-acetylgalactosaminyltransferase n=1 Tax=Leptotrombidium deliense TaxID=299467 RepID=A0A443SW92_9ACAR|nr:putative polypeptide N-acetylgalactosaminyltransferase 9-like protein [Leptotrombidium deliense]
MLLLFPRRRSLFLKVLLLIPVSWFLVTLVITYSDRTVKSDHNVDIQASNVESPEKSANGNIHLEENVLNPQQNVPKDEPNGELFNSIDSKRQRHKLRINDQNKKKEDEAAAVIPPPNEFVGAGEMGKPVILPKNLSKEIEKRVSQGWADNAFNQYISDLISTSRSLPDVRDPACKNLQYEKELPATSVIICFHNEAWSVLIRTVHSVLNRSPAHLIKEIILVDDFSDLIAKPYLGEQLVEYAKKLKKVRVVRAKKREGLIRARLLGFAEATAPVVTYLDSHCECTEGWLEPLLSRIAHDPTAVVCPVIDVISDNTFEYHHRAELSSINVGGFDWNLQFNWHAIPDRQKKERKHSTDPVASPTMAGGLFSISKQFFERLGTYDSGFDIWGGENLELSFKSWMCGGTLEIIPCSHVGHIFRSRSPYKWRTGVNVLKRNSIRLAEVWMDDYKKYYYQRIGNDLGDFGDISERKELRRQLKCNSFEWYIKNIYPELFIPGEAVASGEVRNLGGRSSSKMCLDSAARKQDMHKPIGLYPCHNQGGNQYFLLSKEGEIRRDEACLDYAGKDVVLYPCHGAKGNQLWIYNDSLHQIKHGSSGKCLEISDNGEKLLMNACDASVPNQQWKFQNFDPSKYVKLV